MNSFKFAAAIVAASFSVATGVARADTAPTAGTLVYHFTYSATQNISSRDSANPVQDVSMAVGGAGAGANPGEPGATMGAGAAGASSFGGTLNDKGTMTVNIMKKQPDGALVVMISEQGETVRRASPAECVVYGNTHVICDPNKTVYNE